MVKLAISILLLSALLPSQTSPNGAPAGDFNSVLTQLEQSAQGAAVQLASLRIEKWKTDREYKEQAQSNADSLQRNLTSALPALVGAARNTPQELAANFKLYRNVSALSEVLTSLTESAGAFGKKEEYENLGQYAAALDEARRSLADYFEQLAAVKDAELGRLRTVQQRSVGPTRPKKIIVDNEPEPKSKKKRNP